MTLVTKVLVVLAGFLCGFGCVWLFLRGTPGLGTALAMLATGSIVMLALWVSGKLHQS